MWEEGYISIVKGVFVFVYRCFFLYFLDEWWLFIDLIVFEFEYYLMKCILLVFLGDNGVVILVLFMDVFFIGCKKSFFFNIGGCIESLEVLIE